MPTRETTTKWTEERIHQLKTLYPVTENWEELLRLFPFSTKRGIQGTAALLGLRKPRLTNSVHSHKETLFNSWTEESAYLLGYLEADGHIGINKRYPNSPSVKVDIWASEKDSGYIEQLKTLCGYTGKTSRKCHKVKGKTYYTVGFSVTSREWKPYLDIHFRSGKIPSDIPARLLHHYIRGYFDGDGSVFYSSQNKNIHSNFVSSSLSWIEDLVQCLEEPLGKRQAIYQKTSSDKCWYINLAKHATENLCAYMYQNATIWMQRKKEKFNNESIGSL